jgi:hypothetical protein
MKMEESRTARSRVNQAPSGTLVSAAERKMPSSRAKMRVMGRMTRGGRRQEMRATRETRRVVRKVTRMTQMP